MDCYDIKNVQLNYSLGREEYDERIKNILEFGDKICDPLFNYKKLNVLDHKIISTSFLKPSNLLNKRI